MFSFFVLAGLAVTWIFPSATCALKEWMADGAGASSTKDRCRFTKVWKRSLSLTNVPGANVETS
jgi:hypothetical protein